MMRSRGSVGYDLERHTRDTFPLGLEQLLLHVPVDLFFRLGVGHEEQGEPVQEYVAVGADRPPEAVRAGPPLLCGLLATADAA